MEIVEGIADIEDVTEFLERIDSVAANHELTVQAFDARYVADDSHLRRAVDLATRAIERGEEIADDTGVEILLYAAGRRQIDRALEMGVSTGECPVAVVVVDCAEHEWSGDPTGEKTRPTTENERLAAAEIEGLLESAETLSDPADDTLSEYFDISDRELAATEGTISDLVRERVALLVVER